MEDKSDSSDMINHPAHYNQLPVEVVEIIETLVEDKISYQYGTVLKYVLRARFKGDMLADCKKAKWHLDRLINLLTEEKITNDSNNKKVDTSNIHTHPNPQHYTNQCCDSK